MFVCLSITETLLYSVSVILIVSIDIAYLLKVVFPENEGLFPAAADCVTL